MEVVRSLYAHWERGDLHTPQFFDPEIEHSRIGSDLPGVSGEWRGLNEFGEAIAAYIDALADLHIQAERITGLGDGRVLVLCRQTARGKTSGLPFDHELGELFTLRDGLIVRYDSYWDPAEALRAAGVSEQP